MSSLYKNLLVTSFLVALATTAFPIFLPSYFNEMGLSNFEIGLSMAFLYFTAAMLSLLVGYLERKINKKKILIFSYFGYIFLPIFYLGVGSFISIVLVRIYDGIISSFRYVSKYSILETKNAYKTGIRVSLNESLSNVGCLLGPILSGIVALYYGIDVIFVIAAAILLFTAIYSLKMLKFVRSKNKTNGNAGFLAHLGRLIHNKFLIRLLFVVLLFTIVDSSKFMVITLYMKSLNFNNFSIGLIGGSFFFFIFLFELFSGYLEKKSLRNKLLTGGLLLCALSMVLFLIDITSLYYFLFLVLLFSLGAAFIRPAIFSSLVLVGDKNSYMDTGLLFFFSNIGGTIGLIMSGALIQFSFNLFFILGGILLFGSSLISLLHFRTR